MTETLTRSKSDHTTMIAAHTEVVLGSLAEVLGGLGQIEVLEPRPCTYDLPVRIRGGVPTELPRLAHGWSGEVHALLFPVRALGARSGRLAVLSIPAFVEPERASGVVTSVVEDVVLLERTAASLVNGANVAMVLDTVTHEHFAAVLAGPARRNPLGGLVRQVRRTPQGQ
jgi:hypothetical protein